MRLWNARLDATRNQPNQGGSMKLRVGYELSYECPQPTPMMLMLNTHFSHAKDIAVADLLVTDPPVPIRQYRDLFGNLCSRIVAPVGRVELSTTALLNVPSAMETRPSNIST
jgi:transglutaminase-like putative cysteine protease